VTGNEIVARCLRQHGIEVVFFLMGGPMIECENACEAEGIRMIDVRHEQAAAMMANAYARMARQPSVCMAASGPGVMNLVTGIANAFADSAPVIALGGASEIGEGERGIFQETDQVAVFRPITRWSERCYDTRRLPELIDTAFRHAFGARPGPVYLDLPGEVLYRDVPNETIRWMKPSPRARPLGDPGDVQRAVDLIAAAERPVLVSGSGVLWSLADQELLRFVDQAGIPFFTTPQGRGVIPEDHELSFLGARSTAFRETDLIVLLATRQNYVIQFTQPPRWNAEAQLIQIDLDPSEVGHSRHPDVGIVGDARAVLGQLLEAGSQRWQPTRYSDWASHLQRVDSAKKIEQEKRMSVAGRPIHPLRLCKEVRDFLPRDAVLCVDGQEILTFARQSIPMYAPHSLNSGPFGCMGVGLPFGIGAKAYAADKDVLILHGDGSFGLNAMEMDTALRHGIPVVCVVSNNGGWTADDKHKVGRDLGHTRYDLMFEALGCHGEFVEDPAGIRPALERAFASGKPALVNVVTDPMARAESTRFTYYET
jgi:thiamine pyrophosphate-dependent acetolactate synthase large subunit-like protein